MSDSPLANRRVAFVGCGNMASAIIGGLLERGLITLDRITGHDPDRSRVTALVERCGIATTSTNRELVPGHDIVVLAVKPQVADAVMSEIGSELTADQLVITIMAGVPTSRLERQMPRDVPVVRVMPNTPALVGRGAAALAGGTHATQAHLDLAHAIFGAVGTTVELPEEQMDAVTALSGSGPGYLFAFVEAMIQGGVDAGLSPETSHALAVQTLLGTGHLLVEDREGRSPAQLREAVTSPGGTTEAGLKLLAEADVAGAIRRAIVRATERGRELGG